MNHFEAIEKLLTRGGWKPVRTCGNLRRYRRTRLFPKRWSGISKTLQDYPFGVSPVFCTPLISSIISGTTSNRSPQIP